MKYKLLTDFLGYKKGYEFEIDGRGMWRLDNKGIVIIRGADTPSEPCGGGSCEGTNHIVIVNGVELSIMLHVGMLEKVEKEEWPKEGEKYYRIDNEGNIGHLTWLSDEIDLGYRDFLGIYRTREEAESAHDAVKAFISHRDPKS